MRRTPGPTTPGVGQICSRIALVSTLGEPGWDAPGEPEEFSRGAGVWKEGGELAFGEPDPPAHEGENRGAALGEDVAPGGAGSPEHESGGVEMIGVGDLRRSAGPMPEVENDRATAGRGSVVEKEGNRPFPGRGGALVLLAFVQSACPGEGPVMGEGVEQGGSVQGGMAEWRNGARAET